MIVVRGYVNGRRIVEDLGPAVARVQGRNGSALGGSYVITIVHQAQHRRLVTSRPDGRRHATKYDDIPRCGFLMKNAGEPCVRLAGHAWTHRSQGAMERDAARRRKVYAE